MYNIEVHKRVYQLFSVFYFMGIWSESQTTIHKWAIRIFYLGAYIYWPLSLLLAVYYLDGNLIEKLFLIVMAIPGVVIIIRIYFLLLKKNEIIEFVLKLGTHSIKKREEFNQINNNINVLVSFSTIFHFFILVGLSSLAISSLPFIASQKTLPLNTYFPFDWRSNEIFYWIAFLYVSFIFMISIICTPFTAIVWYLMMSCVNKYKLLGYDFKNIHVSCDELKSTLEKNNVLVVKKENLFLMELISLLKKHQNLKETTNEIKSFFSNLYLLQIGTSGLAICGSVYITAFASTDNPVLYFVYVYVAIYQFFDIFMVTYYGNEIKLWSSRLSYSLFQSNWMEQSKTSKRIMLILMEVLKRPEELVIGKLYPLDLEIFTNILNAAYSMFNILKNMK